MGTSAVGRPTSLQAGSWKRQHRIAKRAADVFACVVSAPIVIPTVGILCLLIRIDSPGAPIFCQTRVGRHGDSFTIYKLRTMYESTRDVPSHELGNAQLTRVGGVLRRLKFDELPQLANVLKGNMSLVGPRPCLPTQQQLIEERARLGVQGIRPGITGPAQLAGIDMSTPIQLAQKDSEYLQRWSFGSDLRMIFATALGAGAGDAINNE